MEIEKKEYGTYVKEITPVHSTVKNMLRAFLAGGAVCTIGQACLGLYGSMGMEKETAAAWTTLTLIAASVLLTGLGLYQRIVKFAGAGAWCPLQALPILWRPQPSNTGPRAMCSASAVRSLPSPVR